MPDRTTRMLIDRLPPGPTRDRALDVLHRPAQHRHTFEELKACCFVGGALDLLVMNAHEGTCGDRCDVTSGACSCGATHAQRVTGTDALIEVIPPLRVPILCPHCGGFTRGIVGRVLGSQVHAVAPGGTIWCSDCGTKLTVTLASTWERQ